MSDLEKAVAARLESVTAELLDEGMASFAKSFDELVETIESKRKELAPA